MKCDVLRSSYSLNEYKLCATVGCHFAYWCSPDPQAQTPVIKAEI